jgi:hypothetical protein
MAMQFYFGCQRRSISVIKITSAHDKVGSYVLTTITFYNINAQEGLSWNAHLRLGWHFMISCELQLGFSS